MNYVKKERLSVAEDLLKFIDNELLPGTDVEPAEFWSGFDNAVHQLAPENKKLINIRDKIQKKNRQVAFG